MIFDPAPDRLHLPHPAARAQPADRHVISRHSKTKKGQRPHAGGHGARPGAGRDALPQRDRRKAPRSAAACSPSATPPSGSPSSSAFATASNAPSTSPTPRARFSPINKFYLIGEIIHNPEVNRQLREMGIEFLPNPVPEERSPSSARTTSSSSPPSAPRRATCGRSRNAAARRRHHLRRRHERLAPRARLRAKQDSPPSSTARPRTRKPAPPPPAPWATNGKGHYLVILTLDECDFVCDYIRHGGDKSRFLKSFAGAHSPRLRSRPASRAHRRRQPDHHAQKRNRGNAAPHRPRHRGSRRPRVGRSKTSSSSTPSAAPPRSGRMPSSTCCATRWTCSSSSAATTARTPRHLVEIGEAATPHLLHPQSTNASSPSPKSSTSTSTRRPRNRATPESC